MGAPVPASEVTVAGEIEAIAESLGELVIAEGLVCSNAAVSAHQMKPDLRRYRR